MGEFYNYFSTKFSLTCQFGIHTMLMIFSLDAICIRITETLKLIIRMFCLLLPGRDK